MGANRAAKFESEVGLDGRPRSEYRAQIRDVVPG